MQFHITSFIRGGAFNAVNPDYNGKSRPSKFAICCPNCITRTLFNIKLVNCNTPCVFIRRNRVSVWCKFIKLRMFSELKNVRIKCLLASS